jgi:energy-coupling factor transport system permease protein
VPVPPGVRRWATGGTAAGLLLVAGGIYGVLVPGSIPGGGIPFVALGAILVGVGLAAGGRRTVRTRYRPDVWKRPEWLVAASGLAVVGCLVAAAALGAPGLQFVVYPLGPPTLPLLAVAGILLGLLPAWVAPVERRPNAPVSRPTRPARDRSRSGSDTVTPPAGTAETPAMPLPTVPPAPSVPSATPVGHSEDWVA